MHVFTLAMLLIVFKNQKDSPHNQLGLSVAPARPQLRVPEKSEM